MIRLSAFADEISADPVEQLDVLERHGIRHVEFRSIEGINVLDLSHDQHERFRDLLRSRGVGLSALGTPLGKITILDPFDPHMARLETALDLADFYGTPRLRVFSFYVPEGVDRVHVRPEVVRRMKAMADRAEARGIALYLENEKGIYGDTAPRVFDLLQAVGTPSLSCAFDPANFLEVGQDIDEAWSMLRPKVLHFHVKDYDLATRKNVPAGAGSGQIPRLIADAVTHGYDGFCTLEPHLLVAEKSHGFTGPERFGEAADALKAGLRSLGVPFDSN